MAKRRKQKHRYPPMPSWFNSAPQGTCRWCNKQIFDEFGQHNLRRRWHKECVHDYLILTDQSYAKRQVKKRDKGVCAVCKIKCRYRNEWDLDHIKPLIEAKGDISYWQMGNLQTLCKDCHKAKTGKENSARIKTAKTRKKGRK